jgi:PAS domain S-box-containing protein
MQKGTEVIGSGNFDYSVDEIRPDEIGDLSRAFNQMAVNLKAVTTSKAVLEQEVTERKKAQEDLRLSEVRFRTQFEEAMDGICLSDAKTGIIIDCNKALAVLVGRDRDELIGKSQQILYPDDGNEGSTIKGFQLHQTERSVKILQDRVVTMTGVVRDVEIKANILNIQGRSVLQGIFRDITDRKQAEAELLQNYEELKKTQQELRALQAELVKSEKLAVLGKLSGGVGHELRNPLGAIKNAAYFLNMALENPDDDVREVLDIINKEIARCEGIISSLLDFARPKPPSRTQVDIPHVLGEVFKKFPVPGTITVVNTLPSGLPTIEADSNQLIQVFGNLVSNAYQSMLDGGTLTLTSDLTPGSISISVTDTGTGISEENMKKLFEPLFTTKAKGIGLGLVVIQTIVKAHGGRIDVLSTEGKGTTFKVTLPITVNGGVFS